MELRAAHRMMAHPPFPHGKSLVWRIGLVAAVHKWIDRCLLQCGGRLPVGIYLEGLESVSHVLVITIIFQYGNLL